MAVNKRKQETSFTLKDVLVVISAMLTAIAPLIANDVRIRSLQSDVTTLTEEAKTTHEDVGHMREELQQLSNDSASNKAILSQLSTNDKERQRLELQLGIVQERISHIESTKKR